MKTGKLILGTVQFGLNYGINNTSGKPTNEEVFRILTYAAENNIKILDTADAYGSASDLIGRFHKNNNYFFDINTKFTGSQNIPVSTQLQISLEKLKVNFINTYFYHQFSDLVDNPELLNELRQIKAKGLVKKIGVSVYGNDQFQLAIENNEIDVIQLPFNLLDNTKKRGELLRLAKQRKKEIHARSIFLQGLFFKQIVSFPVYLRPLIPYVNRIRDLQERYEESMESIALRYVLFQNEIDYVIIGIDNQQQLELNLLYGNSLLSSDLVAEIDSIDVKESELLYPYNWK